MATPGAGISEFPEEFPVFPLPDALLLPHGKLPLRIFEPRYLALVEDALAAGRLLGMIQPDDNAAEGATGPALYRIGCLGRIAAFAETDDGHFQISLTGVARFAVVQELGLHRGYRRVRASFAPFPTDRDPIEAHAGEFDRTALLSALRGYFAHRGFEANWDSINQMPDATLVMTLCMVCPFEPPEKQALLEARTAGDRAQTLLTLLQIDAHASRSQTGDHSPNRSRAS